MLLKHVPLGPLARHVHSMWYQPAVGVDEAGVLLLPSGRHELVISLDLSARRTLDASTAALADLRKCSPATMQFLRSGPYVSTSSGRAATLGVSFKACGLRAFTRTALSDHEDKDVALADLWDAAQLPGWIERLEAAARPAEKFRLLEKMLWSQMRAPLPYTQGIEQAVAWLSDPFTLRSVAAVAEAVDMRPRKFVQVFREHTGLTPKVFARVMRFRAAAHCMRQRTESRWTDAAALCNYFDQAHLVREFRAMAGMSPSAYLQLPGFHATCLPLALDDSSQSLAASKHWPWQAEEQVAVA